MFKLTPKDTSWPVLKMFQGGKKRLGFLSCRNKTGKTHCFRSWMQLCGYMISYYCLKIERGLSPFSVPLLFLSHFWYTLPLNSSVVFFFFFLKGFICTVNNCSLLSSIFQIFPSLPMSLPLTNPFSIYRSNPGHFFGRDGLFLSKAILVLCKYYVFIKLWLIRSFSGSQKLCVSWILRVSEA